MCVCVGGGGRSSTAPLYIVKLIFTSNTRPQTYIHWSITGENRPLLLLVTESLLAPKKGAYNLTSVRTSVRPSVRPSVHGQRFLRSVCVNWFETLGQEQIWSEDYARQIDF